MSHEIKKITYPESRTLKHIAEDVIDYVRNHGDRYGTDCVRMPTARIFDDYEAAEEYIRTVDNGWYDGIAVKFYSGTKDSAKITEYREKIEDVKLKKEEFVRAHSVKAQKAAYIGCTSCGSKLNKEKLKGERCPLCGTDLRAPSTIERIDSFDRRLKELNEKIANEQRKKNATIKWLVKFEYHC